MDIGEERNTRSFGLISDESISISPFLLKVVVDVVAEFAREGAQSELLYADDLVHTIETIVGLGNKLLKLKEVFESKGLKVNFGMTMVVVSGSITQDGLSKSKVDPCWVCSLTVNTYSVLCVQCGRWIHDGCAGVKKVTPKFSRNLTC